MLVHLGSFQSRWETVKFSRIRALALMTKLERFTPWWLKTQFVLGILGDFHETPLAWSLEALGSSSVTSRAKP